MSIVKGLQNIVDAADSRNERRENRSSTAGRWLSLPGSAKGTSVKLRFLQELDTAAPGYVEEAGLGFLAVQHRDPDNFKRRALCNYDDEGSCPACEKGLRQRQDLYVNVLLLNDDGTPKFEEYEEDGDTKERPAVKILSQGYGPKSVTPWLIEYAGEAGSITQQVFKFKRTGAGQTDTEYSLMPVGVPDSEQFDIAPYQEHLIDLDNVVLKLSNEKLEEFFSGEDADSDEGENAGAGARSIW